MSKKLFKETQSFRNNLLFALLLVLLALVMYRLIAELMNPGPDFFGMIALCGVLLVSALTAIWYMHQLRMKIAVSHKSISFRMAPLHGRKHKIYWDNVESCEIVETPEIAQWQGANISFNHEHRYSICGRNGLHLVTKDGQEYFLGSRRLNDLKSALEEVFNRPSHSLSN